MVQSDFAFEIFEERLDVLIHLAVDPCLEQFLLLGFRQTVLLVLLHFDQLLVDFFKVLLEVEIVLSKKPLGSFPGRLSTRNEAALLFGVLLQRPLFFFVITVRDLVVIVALLVFIGIFLFFFSLLLFLGVRIILPRRSNQVA